MSTFPVPPCTIDLLSTFPVPPCTIDLVSTLSDLPSPPCTIDLLSTFPVPPCIIDLLSTLSDLPVPPCFNDRLSPFFLFYIHKINVKFCILVTRDINISYKIIIIQMSYSYIILLTVLLPVTTTSYILFSWIFPVVKLVGKFKKRVYNIVIHDINITYNNINTNVIFLNNPTNRLITCRNCFLYILFLKFSSSLTTPDRHDLPYQNVLLTNIWTSSHLHIRPHIHTHDHRHTFTHM